MKKIIFLLLLTVSVYGQNPSRFAKIQITGNTTSATATKVNVQEANGEVNTQTINTGFNKNIGLGASDVVGSNILLNQYSATPTDWTSQAYTSGSVVFYGGKQWYANSATVAGDVPASSAKWSDLTFEGLYTKPTSINHNDTGNIQGGAIGDYQHVTTAEKTNWNGKQAAISGTANYLTKYGAGGVVASQVFDNGTNLLVNATIDNGSGARLQVNGDATFASSITATNLQLSASSNINLGNTFNTGRLSINNGGVEVFIFDVPNNRLVNNLGKFLTASSSVGRFGSLDNFATAIVTNNIDRVLITNTGNSLFGTSTDNGSLVQANGNITALPATLSNQVVVLSQLTGYAPLASPALTGTPTAPTATAGTNTTQVATTAFVTGADANNVKLTGNQSIAGLKSFTNTGTGVSSGLYFQNDGTGAASRSVHIFNRSAAGQGLFIGSQDGIGAFFSSTNNANNIVANVATGTGLNYVGQNNGTNTFTVDKLGNVTANSFIKSGGTSSESLMADGSVLSVLSGTYTSAPTAQSNITNVSQLSFFYTKIGSIVTCTASYAITVTASNTNTGFDITIPFNRGVGGNRIGCGSWENSGGFQDYGSAIVFGNGITNGLRVFCKPNISAGGTANVIVTFSFSAL